LVASILVIALGLNLFQQAAILPAYAYISLDINPSIELEVDSDRKVISAHPLNEDAKNLLSDLNISGQQLYVSVNLILAEALNEGYLKPGQKNYVLSTVTLENESSNNINYESLAGEINSAIQDNGVEVDSVVLSADHKLYEDAKTEGVSAGKLLVYRQAVAEGQSVTLQQVKDNSITNLVDSYKIKILPNDKKIIIKHHVFKNSPDPKNNKTDKDPEKGKPDSRNRHNPKDDEQVSAPPKKNHNGSQGGNNVSQKQNNKEVNGKTAVRQKRTVIRLKKVIAPKTVMIMVMATIHPIQTDKNRMINATPNKTNRTPEKNP